MKKLLFIFIVILVAVYMLLSFFGSDREYTAEKLFYRASKKYNKVKLNPEATPDAMLRSVEDDLNKIIEGYPETNAGGAASLTLAELYMSNNKYDKTIQLLDAFVSTQEKNISLLTRAHFSKAQAYEKQDKWDKALEELTLLKDKYINTPLGLQVPLYIANYYVREKRGEEAEREFNNAAVFYDKLRQDAIGTTLGYVSSNLLVQTYIQLEKYEEAGQVVEETVINYPAVMSYMQQLPLVESIFVKMLKNPEKALEIYERVAGSTQDAKLKEILKKKIKNIKKIKKGD